VRLAATEENLASLHIAQELGFREIARFSYLEADAIGPRSLPSVKNLSLGRPGIFFSAPHLVLAFLDGEEPALEKTGPSRP